MCWWGWFSLTIGNPFATLPQAWGLPELFIGVILLPIVGNAAEHASAVTLAYRNRMEIALGVAVGSSIQVAVFVVPFCVTAAWALGKPLSLDLHTFETAVVFLSVLVVQFVTSSGRSNWLGGMLLVVMYFLIAVAYLDRDAKAAAEKNDKVVCMGAWRGAHHAAATG